MEQQIGLLLKQKLEEIEQPDLFWESMIEFIESSLKEYAIRLREKGIDPSIFTLPSKQNNEESTKEKLNQIKVLLVSLSRLDLSLEETIQKTNHESETKIITLESELNQKTEKLAAQELELVNTQKEIEKLKAEFMIFKQENEKKLNLQPKQIKTKLNLDLKLVRDRVNMIHDMVLQTDKDSIDTLHGHVNDAIQTIVNQLADKELWPEDEKKPEFNNVKKEAKPVVKRSRRKKNEGYENDQDEAVQQVELNLEPDENEVSEKLDEIQNIEENEGQSVDINPENDKEDTMEKIKWNNEDLQLDSNPEKVTINNIVKQKE